MGYLKRREDGVFTTVGTEDKNLISVRLDDEESNKTNILTRAELNQGKEILEQIKDSTALKQLAKIGLISVIQDKKLMSLLEIVFDNKRKNKRTGIVEFEA